MSLSPGTSLGHYDVTSLLGEGGMGQVWQATDTQLNRQIALKILADAFADDPDRLARFTREAQILASRNHRPAAGSPASLGRGLEVEVFRDNPVGRAFYAKLCFQSGAGNDSRTDRLAGLETQPGSSRE